MTTAASSYVHGYDPCEAERLLDQAGALTEWLHGDTAYGAGRSVLEVGCGVGAQTLTLAQRSPEARFICIDRSPNSIASARRSAERAGLSNVRFVQADIFATPFASASFDDVFVCFVLEHLPRPAEALTLLTGLLKPGGTLTVIEGDHGSTYFHPDSQAAQAAVQCQVLLQRAAGGDALIGRRIYPLMVTAGLEAIRVTPRMVYVDGSRPDLAEGFTRRTFTAMIQGVRGPALAAGLTDATAFDAGLRDLRRTAEPDGTFSYTFYKGVGFKGAGFEAIGVRGDGASAVQPNGA